MATENIYQKNGYLDRQNYLTCIAVQYGVDLTIVSSMAEVLGENEDFDALISQIEELPVL